ncbi:hypothetical protein ACQ4LE_008558 [Meloidogyne hapla]
MQQFSSAFFNKFSFSFASKLCFSTTTKKVTAVSANKPIRLPPGYNPVTPFALYIKEKTKDAKGEKSSEMVKKVSAAWKSMNELEKEQYVSQSKIISEEKKKEFSNLSQEKKEELLNKNSIRIEKLKRNKQKRELHKFYNETNKPKHPMGAFLLFCKDQMEKDQVPKGKEGVIEFGKIFGEKWKVLTEEEKKIYLNKAEELKNIYDKELEIWKNVNADKIEKWNEAKLELKPKKVVTEKKKTTSGSKIMKTTKKI